MNNIEKVLESLTLEFGPDPNISAANYHNAEYIRFKILEALKSQNKKYTKADIFFIKNRTDLGMGIKWGAHREIIETLRDLKIKKVLIPPELVARVYSIKTVLSVFVQSGYSVEWDIDEKKFIMTLGGQK